MTERTNEPPPDLRACANCGHVRDIHAADRGAECVALKDDYGDWLCPCQRFRESPSDSLVPSFERGVGE